MDWKREAADKLRNYEAKLTALGVIPEEIHRLRLASTSIRSAVSDGTPVSGGSNHREDAMLSNMVHRQELESNLEQAKLWVDTVDKALAVLDERERRCVELCYISRSKHCIDRLCEEFGVEKTQVYNIRDAALRKFSMAHYGFTNI